MQSQNSTSDQMLHTSILERLMESLSIARWTSAPTHVMKTELRQVSPTILMLKVWTSNREHPIYYTVRVQENLRTRKRLS